MESVQTNHRKLVEIGNKNRLRFFYFADFERRMVSSQSSFFLLYRILIDFCQRVNGYLIINFLSDANAISKRFLQLPEMIQALQTSVLSLDVINQTITSLIEKVTHCRGRLIEDVLADVKLTSFTDSNSPWKLVFVQVRFTLDNRTLKE